MKYNSTYAYLSLSSHSTPPQQLLNVATKSVLTPNNVNGVRRQNYGEVKLPEVILQSTFSRNLVYNGSQERLNANG